MCIATARLTKEKECTWQFRDDNFDERYVANVNANASTGKPTMPTVGIC